MSILGVKKPMGKHIDILYGAGPAPRKIMLANLVSLVGKTIYIH